MALTPRPLFSSLLFLPHPRLSSHRSCGLLFFGVYWLLILPQMVVFYPRAVLCVFFLYIISVCMQLVLLFNPLSFPPHHGGGQYIGSFLSRCAYVCTIRRSPPFLVWTGQSFLLSLVIYFVVEISLLVPPTIILGCHLVRCSHAL